MNATSSAPPSAEFILAAASRALRAVPPCWPLTASVAVNPFLGQAGETLAATGARLARSAGAAITLPRSWYQAQIAAGRIGDEDLAGALASARVPPRLAGIEALKAAAAAPPAPPPQAVPTIAQLAAVASGIDWPGIVADRLGTWASGYFDSGQALWAPAGGDGALASWCAFAQADRTPLILGLRHPLVWTPAEPVEAEALLVRTIAEMDLPVTGLDSYFHRLLSDLAGWAQFARYRLWQAELDGGSDGTLLDLLAIRLRWEAALLAVYGKRIAPEWQAALACHAAPLQPDHHQIVDEVLQEAAERAAQRRLAAALAAPAPGLTPAAIQIQAVFCIDVRSEPFRRALESVDPRIATAGFAGFFGLGTRHRRFASDSSEMRLPVLLTPALGSTEGAASDAGGERRARITARAVRAWARFRVAAVSSFAFVEAAGLLYGGKLLAASLGLRSPAPADRKAPCFDPVPDLPARIDIAEAVLRAMSKTEGFAPLCLLIGHGAAVVNNPHAAALQCGACGGHSGEVNARLLAGLLNDRAVRAGLAGRGIVIPPGTLFVAGLHDTTAETVSLFDDHPSVTHIEPLRQARAWLALAGEQARAERSRRLPGATASRPIQRRGRDWAETRQEWSLAGCTAFIAAPRRRTAGRSLGGHVFLHEYDWRQDRDFRVLELILTAPVIVASWISLQYYGSVVAPHLFGAGNKLLHNVVGGIGVLEGNGGAMRSGLPWQSVHDGERLVHEPLRLTVCIEAPTAAITEVLRQHAAVRDLFEHRWLHLFALDDEGRMAWRHDGQQGWTSETKATVPVPAAA